MQDELKVAIRPTDKIADLERSFTVFTRLAEDLTSAYSALQAHVSDLNARLETVSQERLEQLQQKERVADRLEKLLSMLPAAVVVLDGSGIIRSCNAAAQALLDTQLIDQRWRDVIKTYFKPQADDGQEISLTSGRLINLTTRALGYEPGQMILMVDLTETRKIQEASSRDQHLSAMGKMVASLAHQIRTPLSSALLYASHLADGQLQSHTHKKFSEKLIDRLKSIEQQIKDMLLCAKSGTMIMTPVRIAQIITAVKVASESLINTRQLELTVHCVQTDCLIEANCEALVGALLNLINNAVDACQHKPIIHITIDVQDENILIHITDNGQGIDESDIHHVIEPFYTTRVNGTGLGLDVVRAVLDSHRGDLAISSKKYVGTCVTLTLPKRQQSTRRFKSSEKGVSNE